MRLPPLPNLIKKIDLTKSGIENIKKTRFLITWAWLILAPHPHPKKGEY